MYTTYQVVSIAQKEVIKLCNCLRGLFLGSYFLSPVWSLYMLMFRRLSLPLVILKSNFANQFIVKHFIKVFICSLHFTVIPSDMSTYTHLMLTCICLYKKNFKYHTTLKFNQKRAGFPLDKKCLTKL